MASVLGGFALAALLAQAPAAPSPTAAAEAKAARGDLAGAAREYAAAARRLEAGGALDRASDALNSAAMAAFTRADYAASARYLDDAIRLSGRAEDWARHAEQIGNLGSVYFFVGRYDDAARVNALALTVTDQHRGQPWASRRRQVILANQAALHQRLGRYADALAIYRRIDAPGSDLPAAERAQVMVNEGALFRRLGDPYKALESYGRALGDFATTANAAGQVAVLTNRGIARALDLRQPDEAVADFSAAALAADAAGNRREALLARLYRGETLLRAGRAALAQPDFTAALAAATALDTHEELWKALYGLGRVDLASGRTTEARAAFDRAITVVDGLRERLAVPATRAEFFQDKREVYDARIAVGLDTDPAAATFALIEQSRARAWRDRLKLDAVTLAGVQARLAPDTVLLAYWWSPAAAAVVKVSRDGAAVTRLTVPPALVSVVGAAMREPAGPDWRPAAAALGRALLPPGLVDGAAHVVVVPDGPLGVVPFEALTVNGAPLVTHAAVSYLPTAALLHAPAATGGWRGPWTRQLAAFGDPLPGDDAWSDAAGAPRLAASAAEVRDIARELGGRHALYLGAGNRKAALLAALQDPPAVLHLATHGATDLVAGERSRLLFSPGAPGGASESLFLREVYDLPLGGVDLAVLSACDTERGPDVRGEGVQGFSRGLLAAGAARAVTTLWRVPDAAAAGLMRVFYYHVQRGVPVDDALALAKRALMASPTLTHPHYWAAFVLTGATDPLPRAVRWQDVAGVALVVVGAAVGIVALRARRRTIRA